MKNLTKTILLSLVLMVFGINVNAQYTKEKTVQLLLSADTMELNGLNAMVDFMVKQDAQIYQNGNTMFTNEKGILSDLAKNANKDAHIHGSSRVDNYMTMCNNDFKDRVMNEKATDRTLKVTWNKQSYKISKHFKMTYDMLIDFINMSQSQPSMDAGMNR
jgi:hypothetical protein